MDTKYLKFLQRKIVEYCNEDNQFEIYWDYDDEISPDMIFAARRYSLKEKISFEDALLNIMCENSNGYETLFFQCVINDILTSENKDIISAYKQSESFVDDLYEAGYEGIEYNVDSLLSNTKIYVNIFFATESERNFDMGAIVGAFGSYETPDLNFISKNQRKGYDYTDNALTYLIHQQGYSINDVYKCLVDNPRGFLDADNFIDSVVNEIVNNTSEGLSELAVLVALKGRDIITFFEMLNDENSVFCFDKKCCIGIFNEWSGCGGLLEIKLEKDFIIPSFMFRDIQIEGASKSYMINVPMKTATSGVDENGNKVRYYKQQYDEHGNLMFVKKEFTQQNYTVNSVYGLLNECWEDCFSVADKSEKYDYPTFEDIRSKNN